MRTLGLVILLAACSSSSSGDPPIVDTQSVETIAMTCSTEVTAYCGSNSCHQTFSAADKDAALCPASVITCGEYQVVLRVEAGKPTTYYYRSGQLVAVAHPSDPVASACLGGPANFNAPKCTTGGRSLTACASQEPPEGW